MTAPRRVCPKYGYRLDGSTDCPDCTEFQTSCRGIPETQRTLDLAEDDP
jgi:hypothetical protein